MRAFGICCIIQNVYGVRSIQLSPPFTITNILKDSGVWYGTNGCMVANKDKTKLYITSTFYSEKAIIIYYVETGEAIRILSQLQYQHVKGTAILTSNDILYLIGGAAPNHTEYVNVTALENNSSIKWNIIHTPFTTPNGHHGSIIDNKEENIYVIGGWALQNSVHKLNIINNKWQRLNVTLPFNIRTIPILYPVNNQIYALKTGQIDNIIHSAQNIYDPISESPTPFPSKSPSKRPTMSPSQTIENTAGGQVVDVEYDYNYIRLEYIHCM